MYSETDDEPGKHIRKPNKKTGMYSVSEYTAQKIKSEPEICTRNPNK